MPGPLCAAQEVRRQFREIPGLMEGTGKPDYARCVQISTQAALHEMIAPGALVMGTPIVVGILCGVQVNICTRLHMYYHIKCGVHMYHHINWAGLP